MTTIRCILVPTDFSASAAHTLSTAAEFAAMFGARIVLVHVIQPSAYPIRNLATISGFPNLQQELRKTIERDLADLRRKIPASIDVVTQIREGIPHDEILDCAAEHKCDLIVMATQGLTGLKHALLGSTTERVVRLSPVPVLTMRHAPD